MKNTFLLFSVLLLLFGCRPSVKVDPGPAKIEFEELEYDFGKYSILEEREHTFTFANTGSEPLIIQKAETSCTCTQIEYPKEPIMPGKRGKIKLTYQARQKHGHFKRNVFVYSNGSEQPVTISIMGEQH